MKRRRVFVRMFVAIVAVCFVIFVFVGREGDAVERQHEKSVSMSTVFVPPAPVVRATGAVLIDRDSGRILYSQNAFKRFYPGDLTKIPAVLTALRRADVEDDVRISASTSGMTGLTYGFQEGERFILSDLLHMMLFRPEFDPGVAVAVHVSGSIDAFARQMNAEVQRLGATASRFADPNGRDVRANYSTAFDLAWIAREALNNEHVAAIVSRRRTRIVRRGQRRTIFNVNSFLARRPDAFGVKSGYSPEENFSLVGYVHKEGKRLIVVVWGSPTAEDRFYDASSLIDYGLAHFDTLIVRPYGSARRYEVKQGDTLSEVARRFDVPLVAILTMNHTDDADTLRLGQLLWIPR